MGVNYGLTIQRILEILKDDKEFRAEISEFRFGELPEDHYADSYPAVYVTTSHSPEVDREQITPNPDIHTQGRKQITSEYWIIVVFASYSPQAVQAKLYELQTRITDILEGNNQLRRKRRFVEPDAAEDLDALVDPMASSITVTPIRRLTRQKGKMTDGINVVIHAHTFED